MRLIFNCQPNMSEMNQKSAPMGSGSGLWAIGVRGLLPALLALSCATAQAAPEEIQVYMDEFNDPGQLTLDVHTNYVPTAQPGSPTRRQFQATPEWGYGINPHWEAGLYLLSGSSPEISSGHPVVNGAKLRFKWRPWIPAETDAWRFALNWEVGHLAQRFNPDESSTQLKIIEAYRQGPWLGALNLNINGSLHQHPSEPSSIELDGKMTYQISSKEKGEWRIGLERYDVMGALHPNINQPSPHSTSNFLVADFSVGDWDFDVGIGRAYGSAYANTDKTVLKVIIGVPI